MMSTWVFEEERLGVRPAMGMAVKPNPNRPFLLKFGLLKVADTTTDMNLLTEWLVDKVMNRHRMSYSLTVWVWRQWLDVMHDSLIFLSVL
jgi:hypothetical protein